MGCKGSKLKRTGSKRKSDASSISTEEVTQPEKRRSGRTSSINRSSSLTPVAEPTENVPDPAELTQEATPEVTPASAPLTPTTTEVAPSLERKRSLRRGSSTSSSSTSLSSSSTSPTTTTTTTTTTPPLELLSVEKPSTFAKAEPVIEVVVKLDKGKERDIETSGEWKEPEDECEVDESQEDPSMADSEDEGAGWLEEDDDIGMDIQPQALTSSGIMEAREAKVKEVCEFLCVDTHDAQTLLTFFKWDKNQLFERYLESKEKVCNQAGVQLEKSNRKKLSSISCSVCFEDINDEQKFSALGCDHYFCNTCWKDHLTTQINEGKSCEIACMQVGCNLLVPDHLVNRLIDAELFKKYLMFTSKAFVEGSNMKWCPKPGCTNAIHSYTREGKCSVAKCSCGFKFCWVCLEEAHTPATCDLVAKWKKKCEDDSETYNWIASNTKTCPKCKICIEKNDGCFQMTCRQCRFQWCWLCCEDWKTHSDHFSCTKYKGTKVTNKPQFQSQETHQEALDRYLHYYNRYINHLNSLKHEDKTREKAREKMQELLNQDHENFYYNVDFIEEALVALLECRRTLKWTYVWAYYETDELKKELFEFGQSSLEALLEKLSRMLLDQPVDKIVNTEISHLTKLAQKSLHQLFLTDRD